MSSESHPISADQFALAIQDLPVENLYSKAHEIANSIGHLDRSNKQLQEYIDSIRADTSLAQETREEGDRDCTDAIRENEVVIQRQRDRIGLLKSEVERRGARWHEGDGGTKVNGGAEGAATATATNGETSTTSRGAGGRLTDEELRRQMMDRLGDDDNDDQGMHL